MATGGRHFGVRYPVSRRYVCTTNAVNPHVFKHQFSTYQGYADSALKLGAIMAPIGGGIAAQFAGWNTPRPDGGSSHSSRAAWIGVGTAALAAAGTAAATAVLNRGDSVNESYRWVVDHLMFVRNLWDTDAMEARLADCIRYGISFHCFYTRLVSAPGSLRAPTSSVVDPTIRTFVLLPDETQPYAHAFSALDSVGAAADAACRG